MSLKVFQISDYDHAAEKEQFDAVKECLENKYRHSPKDCLLIGNYNIEGVELDALIIASAGAKILEFKNWGGHIIARENGAWTSDGMVVEGGAGKKTPYEQIRLNKSRTSKGLKKLIGIESKYITADIIFRQDCTIDTEQLSCTVKTWLKVYDNQHLHHVLERLDAENLTCSIANIVHKLHIEEFIIEDEDQLQQTTNKIYEPESSSTFFEYLEDALTHIPDYKKVYSVFNRVFQQCLNQNTSGNRLNLSGTFAKTDFLLKEKRASKEIIKQINDTRVRLRKRSEMSASELKKWYVYDLRNLSNFIAFIYNTIIPDALRSVFPIAKEEEFYPKLKRDYLRMIVEQWDSDYVYGSVEESNTTEGIKVCYSQEGSISQFDWSYLGGMFYRGAQLNIIRPREHEGVVYPELIIFEPDYLVDISSVARCFTNYADSPFVNLIKKLEPAATSEAIVLGNFASQLLDEQIHQHPYTHSYNESVMGFWKSNAINLLTTSIGTSFYEDAQLQKTNIAKAIGVDLPNNVSSFNPKECMVEPSFFSELLGLQGRMDLLQLDYKILLEQKSGKGEYPQGNYTDPKYKEEHYVQMLLYMMLIRYNFSEQYEKNGKSLYAFLLYSKYKNSLLGLGFAPELMFSAVKVRNGLVWTEILYTKENGVRILETLTPEKLNMKKDDSSLWRNFQFKQINEVLSPIQNASELERAYYFRFLTFISNEHVLSKIGNKTKENSGFASKWYDSLEDKRQAGNIYDNLTLISPNQTTEGSIDSVRLKFYENDSNDMANFRAGDIVVLYPYEKGKEPDVRKTMVFRCTIKDIGISTIDLALRASQSDARVFMKYVDQPWAIEHDFMESSYSSLYKGMHAFLSAPQTRKDLLLLQRYPEINSGKEINGDYGSFNELVSKVKKAEDLFLIIGPPGTGKTSYGLLNTLKEELTERDSSILLLSYTNRAVDEICSKLQKDNIDFIRIGGELTCALEYRDKLLSSLSISAKKVDELKKQIVSKRVFVATTTAMNTNLALFQLKQFSLAIIDEASQILEPHLMGILCSHRNGVPSIGKFVLIGDHKQLPAVVQQSSDASIVQNVTLNEIHLTDCRLSLFERLLKKYLKDENVVYLLKKQGRMHHDIAMFPNYTFYQNQLEEVPCKHQNKILPLEISSMNGIDKILCTRRISFLNAKCPSDSISDKINAIEAEIIAATVLRIYNLEKEHFDVSKTVGIIVPYRNQIATIRKTIDKSGIGLLHDITIDTVERYQGSQRKYIIYGFTIQKYYQLKFLTNNVFKDLDGSIIDRKLNVALTRAEEHLIIVGNAELLSNNFTFFKLIEFIRSRHGLFNVDKEKYVTGNFEVPDYEPFELDLSQAVFTTTPTFDKVFETHVLNPIKLSSATIWPEIILGHDMATNLNAIGYGRINFSNQLTLFDETEMSPQKQVLLYCYYIMRQHYCSCRNLYDSYKDFINSEIEAVCGRVQMIDIGCGPATCGIAFSELFIECAPNMVYTGIDISTEMKVMGRNFMEKIFGHDLCFQTFESFKSIGQDFWNGCSELPSLVIINLSYFFSNITPQFAEKLATQILDIIKRYPLNKYLFVVQHSEIDSGLISYKTFRRIIAPYVKEISDRTADFSYRLHYKEHTLNFCYSILMNN